MSDARLRTLERRAWESPTPEAQADLLRERVRLGLLDPERLRLAAYAGHEGARVLVIPKLRPPGHDDDTGPYLTIYHQIKFGDIPSAALGLSHWLKGLASWGHEVMVRAAIAAARVAFAKESKRVDDSGSVILVRGRERVRRKIEAAEAWAACPCEEHREEWANAGDGPSGFAPRFDLAQWQTRIFRAKALTSPGTVRAAICSGLVAWALS